MRIDDVNRTPQTQGTEKPEQADGKRQPGKGTGVAGADQADVSQLARGLVSDPQRIEQLRLEVESGKYKVPASAIAQAIIDAHLKE